MKRDSRGRFLKSVPRQRTQLLDALMLITVGTGMVLIAAVLRYVQ